MVFLCILCGTVHAIVNASFHNAQYSGRIWMYQDMMKPELSKLWQEGLVQGKNPRKLAVHTSKPQMFCGGV
ncbi:MAG: hypothetical protein HFG41_06290 [Coprococcus sp.]|nr:hypothetical protein [Coprococcus sp.]